MYIKHEWEDHWIEMESYIQPYSKPFRLLQYAAHVFFSYSIHIGFPEHRIPKSNGQSEFSH